MISRQAKAILQTYRPGVDAESDPEIAAALKLAQEDPELREWWEQHRRFQQAVREKFQGIPVPSELKDRILSKAKVIRPSWWQTPWAWAAAALFVLLAGLASIYRGPEGDGFGDYRQRMVRTVLREYRMNIVTNDLKAIRQFLAGTGGPADYELPAGLALAKPSGAGILKWHGNPVSMVCFDRGTNDLLFLFVVDKEAVEDPPPDQAVEYQQVNKLMTANWSRGARVYVLAGLGSEKNLQPYMMGR